MSEAIVVGGGLAGIAAAFALRDRGLPVELCESRPQLGGRVFSLPAADFSYRLDNGPHVMLGCYTETRALLRRLGTERAFDAPRTLRLCYADTEGRIARLRLLPGPTPVMLPLALACLPAFGWRAKARAVRGLGAVLRGAPADWTLERWLDAHGQAGAPRRFLWDPMCRAILNAEASQVDAALFLATLRRAFLGSGVASAIWMPRSPWSAIVGEPARDRLVAAGVRVRSGRRLVAIDVHGDRVAALRFGDGEVREVAPDTVVVTAIPWHALAKALPDPALLPAASFAGSPIVSVYFDVEGDPDLPADPLIALVDGEPFHFLARRPGAPPGAFAVLSGGGTGLDGLDVAAIERAARAQLARHFPRAAGLDGGRARVVKEARATVLLPPGSAALRPAPGSGCGLANLRIAGDWTATGLPSTLEGAVSSGLLAVRAEAPTMPWTGSRDAL